MSRCDIYIISLEGFEERLKSISKQLNSLNLDYEIFYGVDGKKGNHSLFEMYNHEIRMKNKGKPLSITQLGCFASHYLLWKKCIELDKPLIVMEDDAIIVPEVFMDFYKRIDFLDSKYECIRLFNNRKNNYRYKRLEKFDNFSIAKYLKGPMGAVGYYLTPLAASKFIKNCMEWTFTVDIYMDRFWYHKVECYGTIPKAIDHDINLFGTSIEGAASHRMKRNFAKRVRREIFSSKEFILRIFHNIKFILNI